MYSGSTTQVSQKVKSIPPDSTPVLKKPREINKDASTNKAVVKKNSLNIKDLAAKMQEERESFDDGRPKPQNYPKDKN